MYGTKSLSYVKVKCWVESDDFHSPGSVTFIKGDTGWISAKAYQRRPEILKKAWSVGLFW